MLFWLYPMLAGLIQCFGGSGCKYLPILLSNANRWAASIINGSIADLLL